MLSSGPVSSRSCLSGERISTHGPSDLAGSVSSGYSDKPTAQEGTTSIYAIYPSLSNRVVIVTGASGIGEAIVEAFTGQKAKVVFLDVQDSTAEQLVLRLKSAGLDPPAYFHCDLTDIDSLQSTTQQILERFGTVDTLVNNAGDDTRHSLAEVTSSSWDQSMAINLKAQFFMAQSVIPAMQKAGRGSIINLGSIAWILPPPTSPCMSPPKLPL